MNPAARSPFDAIVVGAGPAGSATATFLAEAGFSVLLLERARFPRPKPCAEYLSPAASRVLERLNVLPAIEALGPARLTGMRIVSPAGVSFTGRFVSGHGYRAHSDHGLALPREKFDQVLALNARARGVELRERHAVAAVRPDGGGRVEVEVHGPGGRVTLRARLVIGADGLNSRIARALGLARRGGRRRVALVTHLRGMAGMTDVGEMHVARRAYVGLAPVGGDLANVALVADLDRTTPVAPAARWLAELLGEFPAVLQRMEPAEQVTPVRVVGPFARRARRATADGILLVGDAADFYDPFTGEGIYAALAGAELAAEHAARALRDGRTDARSLSAYDGARRRMFGGKWLFERAVSGAVALPAVFNRIASRLARRPLAADLMVGAAGDFVPVSRLLRPDYLWQLVA